MDLGLKGKIAFVTGASSGIGAATARLFAQEGADVIVCYHRNRSGAEQTAQAIERCGRQSWLVAMDTGDCDAVSAAIKELKSSVPELDAAVLCAGTNAIAPLLEVSPLDWDDVIRVNLNGTFYVLRAVAPLLRDSGSIVTVASVAAHTGAAHHAHYAAAKGGIVSLTKSAARALAPRIRVNCVAPGLAQTEMGLQAIGSQPSDYLQEKLLAQRMALPEEIARSIVFLASPAAGFMYGATLDVNGGRDLR
ncbi:MAG TPA: SDR family NAD(P)-dependent oxidoreductase [Pirellulales bacterium]|nr:SDR family NAD(P)-dependent oxidoreductase [Pirellulales bacterium]